MGGKSRQSMNALMFSNERKGDRIQFVDPYIMTTSIDLTLQGVCSTIQGPEIRRVRGCEKFLPAPA